MRAERSLIKLVHFIQATLAPVKCSIALRDTASERPLLTTFSRVVLLYLGLGSGRGQLKLGTTTLEHFDVDVGESWSWLRLVIICTQYPLYIRIKSHCSFPVTWSPVACPTFFHFRMICH